MQLLPWVGVNQAQKTRKFWEVAVTERLRPALQVVLQDLIKVIAPDDLTDTELLIMIALLTSARDRVHGITPPSPSMTLCVGVTPQSVEATQQFASEIIVREGGG